MAKCAACGKDMRKVNRCAYTDPLTMLAGNATGGVSAPRVVPRVPYTSEARCPDCLVVSGALHHPGCDTEECPLCHGQLISCDCVVLDPEEG
jgi:hypothetical protein